MFLRLRDCLFVYSLLRIRRAQVRVSQGMVRTKFHGPLQFLNCLVIAARKVEGLADIRVDARRERVERPGCFNFGYGLLMPA